MTTALKSPLSEDLIGRCGARAAGYDQANTFFNEDFEELKAAGYLKLAVPEALGGYGMNLSQVVHQQERLAYRAPATALAINMHLYWTGVAQSLKAMGDSSLDWIMQEAAAGEVFAAGHGERGNDLPLFLSTANAQPVDGGYKLTGHKMFSSLTPVWTRLGIHAMDTSDPNAPKIVHVFMPRDTPGWRTEATWDTLAMRATRSDDTVLEGAFVPDRYVARVLPAGAADEFVLSVFGWFEPTCGGIYLALARRAQDLAVDGVKQRSSLALTRSMAYHPEVQHVLADAVLATEAAAALLHQVADDWSNGVDHGAMWPMKLVAAKHMAVEAARKMVDAGMTVSGGSGMFRRNELERLYRDVRAGGFHPANTLLVHEIVGKTVLGIDLGEQPRWG